jgi:serine/threonine-protein kinase
VIHRDIKPENILMHDGRPMVADFGIALAVSAAAGGRMTETGLSLGTPHYMSPEQATAEKDLTARSDIYSLGSMLYEMLTGSPPHVGASAQQIIMKIVTEDAPPVTELRKSVPPHLAAAAAQALEKLPADRFDSAAAFAAALANPAFASRTATTAGPLSDTSGGWKQRWAVPFAALAAVFFVAAILGWMRSGETAASPVIRYAMSFPNGEEFVEAFGVSLAVSPDGSRLVYLSGRTGAFELRMRTRDLLTSEPLVGTEDAWQPFFSPDGQRVAFVTGGRALKIVSLRGEPPRTVLDSGMWRVSGSWGTDGFLYVSMQDHGLGLVRVPVEGGTPEPVTTVDTARGEVLHSWPAILPDGRGMLFTAARVNGQGHEDDEVAVVDLATGEHRVLVRGLLGRYVAGHLLFVQYDGTLMAAPFDEGAMELTGAPRALGAAVVASRAGPDLAVSASGRLVYDAQGSGSRGEVELMWVDREGRAEMIELDHQVALSHPFGVGGPVLSPDGKWVTLAVTVEGVDMWLAEVSGGPMTRLSFDGTSMRPMWSPDSRSVLYRSEEDLSYDLYSINIDGSGVPELVVAFDSDINHGRWSDDGQWLLVATDAPSDVYAIEAGSDEPLELLTSPYNETSPVLSPDGRWLAYVSDESGTSEVYVSSFPEVHEFKRLVSVGGGVEPMWAHSGDELFYKDSQRRLVAASVRTVPAFVVVDRTPLFTFDPAAQITAIMAEYDVAEDDQRFLTFRGVPGQSAVAVTVVENFVEELRERVGN